MKAQLISKYEVKFPTQEDYLEDGVTFKNPMLWKEYVDSEKPAETIMQKYRVAYAMHSDSFQGPYKIVKVWEGYIEEPIGEVAKLNGSELIFPKTNETVNGCITCNYPRLPNSRKLKDGWLLIKETAMPTDGKQYRRTGKLVEDPDFGSRIEICWSEIPATPEQPFDISKLKLKRAMDALGKWEAFLDVLKSNPSAFEDFNLAVSLMSNDPLVLQFKGVCMQMFGFTSEQIDAMLKQCKSDI